MIAVEIPAQLDNYLRSQSSNDLRDHFRQALGNPSDSDRQEVVAQYREALNLASA